MATKLQHIQNLRHIFLKSLESVCAVRKNFILPLDAAGGGGGQALNVQIQDKTLQLTGKKCHVVGFGKAVLGMAVQLESVLQQHLVGGILSIPTGTLDQFIGTADMQLAEDSRIRVIEGAPNNQPDESALAAAREIKQLASSMREDDVLFVLISGGGSALLPLPRSPLTLVEKMQLVRQLANCGASIDEMNVVRIALSDIKGGQLAAAARRAHAVVSFVISDIVGDPLDLIASGPTCGGSCGGGGGGDGDGANAQRHTAKAVLQKYELWSTLPPPVQQLIETPVSAADATPGTNNAIHVVANNRVATARAAAEAQHCGYEPFVLTTTLQGEVQRLAAMYSAFLRSICEYRAQRLTEQQLRDSLPFEAGKFEQFLSALTVSERTGKPLLLILAGEPTVKVKGTGLGGRNQELALRMALELYEHAELEHICFLSAGTDGFDGPTPAAGAIGCSLVVQEYLAHGSDRSVDDVRACLRANDSYHFFKNLDAGRFHVITGHTGTNVMDLQLLLVA